VGIWFHHVMGLKVFSARIPQVFLTTGLRGTKGVSFWKIPGMSV